MVHFNRPLFTCVTNYLSQKKSIVNYLKITRKKKGKGGYERSVTYPKYAKEEQNPN